MACSCKSCMARAARSARPVREEMTLIQGDADREIRAAIKQGVLMIDAYDSDGSGGWERDPEYGVVIREAGFQTLRKLLDW